MVHQVFPTCVEDKRNDSLSTSTQHTNTVVASFLIFYTNALSPHRSCKHLHTNRDARQHRLSDKQHRIGACWSRIGFWCSSRLGDRGAGQRADLHNCRGCFGEPVSHHFSVQESETEECRWDAISLCFKVFHAYGSFSLAFSWVERMNTA